MADSAASAAPKAWTAPALSSASPTCDPGNKAASTTATPVESEIRPPPEDDGEITPAASMTMRLPSPAASSRTGVFTENRGPAVPALSQVVPSASRRSGPEGGVATSTAAAIDVGDTLGVDAATPNRWSEASVPSRSAPSADGCSWRTPMIAAAPSGAAGSAPSSAWSAAVAGMAAAAGMVAVTTTGGAGFRAASLSVSRS